MKLMQAIIFTILVINSLSAYAMFSWFSWGTTSKQEDKNRDLEIELHNKYALQLLQQINPTITNTNHLGRIVGPQDSAYALTAHPTERNLYARSNISNVPTVTIGDAELRAEIQDRQFIKFNPQGSLAAFKDGNALGDQFARMLIIFQLKRKKSTKIDQMGAIHNFSWSKDNLIAVNHLILSEGEKVSVFKVDEQKLEEETNYKPEKLYSLNKCNFWWNSFNPQGDILVTNYGDITSFRKSTNGQVVNTCKTSSLASFIWNKEGTVGAGIADKKLFFANPKGESHFITLDDYYYRLDDWQTDYLALRSYKHESDNKVDNSKVKIYNWKRRDWSVTVDSKDGIFSVAINPKGTMFALGKYNAMEFYDINGKHKSTEKIRGIARQLCWNCDGTILWALIFGRWPMVESFEVNKDETILSKMN